MCPLPPRARAAIGQVPEPRQPRTPPRGRVIARVPKTRGVALAPPQHAPQAPAARGVGAVPNPRKPQLVRAVNGGVLQDLFAFFPDLPRPARPKPRIRLKR